jgi:hypothetical protein
MLQSKLYHAVTHPIYTRIGDPLLWPHDTLYPQKLALTSPTSGGRSVGIVHSRTKATEFSLGDGMESIGTAAVLRSFVDSLCSTFQKDLLQIPLESFPIH